MVVSGQIHAPVALTRESASGKGKGKGKVQPTRGHEGPEEE